ncbi:MAG: glycosyltransferase family 2 protein [Zavarzinella sp.]|nr:glycosyltransferase family 2 protein [Zavarzinella sp.]
MATALAVSLGLVWYVYIGYPALVWALARLFGRPPVPPAVEAADLPSVTLLVVAHNEERDIGARIENALSLHYPRDRFEIVIASDGSTDATNDIVRRYANRGVVLLAFPTNRGKAAVLNDAFRLVKGDVVVLSDANTHMAADAIRHLGEWFADPDVGVVCGKLALVDSQSGKNVDGAYWKYENFLKKCESRLGALLGTNGAIYAIRRRLFPGATDGLVIDDFVIPMTARLRSGCRIQYDPRAVASEETPADLGSEFRRRCRIGAGGYQAIGRLWPLLNPRHGWVAFTFLSHKVLRWLCPFFLVAGFGLNVALLDQSVFRGLFGLQVGFYGAAFAAHFLPARPRFFRYLKLTTMFVLMNAALFVGFFRWTLGRQGGTWQRTARTGAGVPGTNA